MKTLTKTQQEIVNSIVNEFETFNAPINDADPNDLISFINNALNEKQRFVDEVKITNKAYDIANESQVMEYVNEMNAILDAFGYYCELEKPSRSVTGITFAQYFKVKITWTGHRTHIGYVVTSDVFFHPNISLKEGTTYLFNSSLNIYKKYCGEGKIDSFDGLMKYVAEMIIEKQKSLIK
jgi:hypothetical protein